MGSKIRDTAQEYQFTLPFVTPSGHEWSFYDTPENERVVMKHTSGSHIEFKADGSIFIKAVKDIHTHSSVLSDQGGSEKAAEMTTQRVNTDYVLEVGGRLKIRCSELDFEIGSTGRIIAGTDLFVTSNNMVNKATESISLEATKSVYLDTKEFRERVVSHRSEHGTMEDDGPSGGVSIMNVNGNAVIRNDDPNGGITIASAGYLNLVCGQERVDLIGKFTPKPSLEAVGTFTTKVFKPTGEGGVLNVSTPGGDTYFESESSLCSIIAKNSVDPKYAPYGYIQSVRNGDNGYLVMDGSSVESVAFNRTRKVGLNENVRIGGVQKVKAKSIYLN